MELKIANMYLVFAFSNYGFIKNILRTLGVNVR